MLGFSKWGEGREVDSTLFAAYVREHRTTTARTYFVYALLGAAMAIVFAGALTFVLSPRALTIAHISCAEVAAVIAIYALFTRSDRFVEARSAEFFVFAAVLPGILGIVYALSLDEARVGWPAHTVLFDNVIILVSFSTFAFVANFRALAIWFALLIPTYVVWLFAIGTPAAPATFNLISAMTLAALATFSTWSITRQGFSIFLLQRALRAEQQKTEKLLYSVLPSEIAERLKSGESVADPFEAATVVFVDIVGSSALARRISPTAFIDALNAIFGVADRHAMLHGVEKVKTIGDAYLVVAGGRAGGDAAGALQFALGVIRDVAKLSHERELGVGLRIGMHTGPVIGGVIGTERALYDYWGDTMNIAARLEGVARVNCVAVSELVYNATSHIANFQPPRTVNLKGIGEFDVYDFIPAL